MYFTFFFIFFEIKIFSLSLFSSKERREEFNYFFCSLSINNNIITRPPSMKADRVIIAFVTKDNSIVLFTSAPSAPMTANLKKNFDNSS